jgi:hypothetical protein
VAWVREISTYRTAVTGTFIEIHDFEDQDGNGRIILKCVSTK